MSNIHNEISIRTGDTHKAFASMPCLPCRHDENINTLALYSVIPFEDSHGTAGYAMRVLEIYRLASMLPLVEQFESLTGYRGPRADCTKGELNRLILRGQSVCDNISNAIDKIKSNISLNEMDLLASNRGELGGSIDSIRERAHTAASHKQRYESQLSKAQFNLDCHRGLLALLRNEVTHRFEQDANGWVITSLRELPLATLPHEFYKKNLLGVSASPYESCHYAWSALDKIEISLFNIIKLLTPSTDKHTMRNTDSESVLEARKYYYSPSGDVIRWIMSAEEFIKISTAPDKNTRFKSNKMQALIDGY
ncbi:hypothetical protein U5A91_001269 [Yersinia enterocolitica]|nr:hypothetical protein [Yersinia enterocolitica]